MGHVRRMQSNRRRLIHEMIKEKYNEKRNSGQHDELSSGESEVPQGECDSISNEPSGYRGAPGHNGSD